MSTTAVINEWVTNTESALVQSYNDKGLKASGEWETTLNTEVEYKQAGVSISVKAASYTQQMEDGRRPGAMPNVDVIAKWMVDKGIVSEPDMNAAWAISKHIEKKGTIAYQDGGTDFVSDVITSESINKLVRDVGLSYLDSATSEIKSILKDGSN